MARPGPGWCVWLPTEVFEEWPYRGEGFSWSLQPGYVMRLRPGTVGPTGLLKGSISRVAEVPGHGRTGLPFVRLG